jgi:hypothetical protein
LKFGTYEIIHELKSGGMGSVLIGRRRGPGAFEQLVAIKTIRPEHANTAAVRAMFLDEAAILARLHHPGVATVHDFGEEGGTLYMVMEYVAGIAFRDLAEMKPHPLIAARAIAEACRGLHAAHEVRDLAGHPMGLVHRDISPDNLMLGYDGHVKVIDFGIALVKNRQAPVTEFGTVKGKPPYMSPEQVTNEAMDRRSDVFSLAIVLWEMLTGEALFTGDSLYAVAYAVGQQEIKPPSQVRGEPLPHGLDAAVLNALDRNLAHRTPTAAQFAEELEQVVQASGGESLAAWAERELKVSREQHTTWLAGIATDHKLPKLAGRSSAEVTELGAEVAGAMPKLAVTPEEPAQAEAPLSTSIGGTSVGPLDAAPRRKLGPIVVVLLLLLAAGGIGVYFITRPHEASVRVVHDAAVAPPADAPAPRPIPLAIDAAPPPIDAPELLPPPIDAGHHHVPVDGPTRKPDAAIAIDAPPAPAGTGFLIAKNKPGGTYLNVIVDGKQLGVTPILGKGKALPAGKHHVQLVRPDSGDVVVDETISIEPDQKAEITER